MAKDKFDANDSVKFAVVLLVGMVLGIGIANVAYPPASQPAAAQPPIGTLPADFATFVAKVPVLAVQSSDNTGVMSFATVEIQPGQGRVLINTNPFIEPDTQQSAETAVTIAQQFTKKSLAGKDVILTFASDSQLVGGPSAGGAMTVAMIAAIENKTIAPDVAMTGTIEADGSIGAVGGILEKAEAAAAKGIKLFLVPKGEANLRYYEQQVTERTIRGFVIQQVRYVPKTLDLAKYEMDNHGMTVREVSDIAEAAEAFGL